MILAEAPTAPKRRVCFGNGVSFMHHTGFDSVWDPTLHITAVVHITPSSSPFLLAPHSSSSCSFVLLLFPSSHLLPDGISSVSVPLIFSLFPPLSSQLFSLSPVTSIFHRLHPFLSTTALSCFLFDNTQMAAPKLPLFVLIPSPSDRMPYSSFSSSPTWVISLAHSIWKTMSSSFSLQIHHNPDKKAFTSASLKGSHWLHKNTLFYFFSL